MYEWDEQKRLFNIDKHGMDFFDAVQVFDGRFQFTYLSPRNGENRLVTVAEIEGSLWVIVWMPKGKKKRIISAHRADNAEIKKYRKLLGERN